MDFNKIKYVSWDLDGTLYDLAAMKKSFSKLVVKSLFSKDFFIHFKELWLIYNFHLFIRKKRDRSKIEQAELPLSLGQIRRLTTKWYGQAISQVGPSEASQELIHFFESKNIKQIIVSDYDVNGKIESLFPYPFWEKTFSGLSIGYMKPSKEIFKHVLNHINIAPDELLHLGDKDHYDGEAARACGVQVLILKKDFKDYKTLLKSLEDLCP